MKTLFEDMFRYHHHFNQKLIDELEKHKNSLPARTIPLFCHVLNAHQIWNSRLTQTLSLGVRDEHTLEECRRLDKDNFQQTLTILDTLDFGKVVDYKNSKGEAFANTAQDILFHVVNHTTHHRGQIMSDFRQAGIPPLVSDYIFFKRT